MKANRSVFSIILLAFSAFAAQAQSESRSYGSNLITAAPISVSEQGVGFGIGYERSLDERGIFNFYLPVSYSFQGRDDYYRSHMRMTNPEYMFHAYPGFKIYPAGAFGKIRYAVGPSVVIGFGSQYEENYLYSYPDPWTGVYKPNYVDRMVLGAMVNNSLNIHPTERLYLGIEMGLGVTYLNKWDNRVERNDALLQASFRMGYRF